MKRVAAAVVLVLAAGCSSTSGPQSQTKPITPHPTTVTPLITPQPKRATRLPAPVPTTFVDANEYRADETFCARPPSTGRIYYLVDHHVATLRLAVTGLPHHADLGVGWTNAHTARSYVIASFLTDNSGRPRQASLRMFRGGETRGSSMFLNVGLGRVVANLRPCGVVRRG